MKIFKPRILVITPVHHIAGVSETLEDIGEVRYMDEPCLTEVLDVISEYDAIYTNPNKSQVYIGQDIIDAGNKLKVICTASTGTNHIDKVYAAQKAVPILSLTEERDVINRISSTAELAFALTLVAVRHVIAGHNAVMDGNWDYTKYIGRQMNYLTVGVIGYGRLGSLYAGYCNAFGSKVYAYDPYKKIDRQDIEQLDNLDDLLKISDVIALHVHVTDETSGMINYRQLNQMKSNVILVNTSRGDVINERDIVNFLKKNNKAKVATDVLADEIRNRLKSPLLEYAQQSSQVIITPHIGGMTREAQEIAYGHAAFLLGDFFSRS